MADVRQLISGACVAMLIQAAIFSASAQDQSTAITAAPLEAPVADPADRDADPAFDPDNSADSLNASQQIEQSFTFTRTINGQVVDTEKKTITYSRNDPVRPTEAGTTALEQLKISFDNEVLTREEAFEEAKIDFVIADLDRDNFMTADEFVGLVQTWRENDARKATAPDHETARQRQYRAFVDELDPAQTKVQTDERAKKKFMFMVGVAEALSRQDYMREYLLDFDSMDANSDMLLKGEELLMFRALNKGENLQL